MLLALVGASAYADFREAVAKHASGDFAAARAEFERLADLGDAPSQFNLGAMALRGEGGSKDTAVAVGWMLAATENGYEGLVRGKLDAAREALSPDEAERAKAIVARYGKAAIAERVLPPDERRWLACTAKDPRLIEAPDRISFVLLKEAYVIVSFTVGIDGLVRDPEVLLSMPAGRHDREAVRLVLSGRYSPATIDGKPVEMRTTTVFRSTADWPFYNWTRFVAATHDAHGNDPSSQYVVGVAGLLDERLGIDRDDAREMLLKSGQGGVARAQYWVAREFDGGVACRDERRNATWLEHAATSGDPRAQVLLAARLLQSGDSATRERARSLVHAAAASQDAYAIKHAVALAVDPAFDDGESSWMLEAATRLQPPRRRVDPQEEEVAAAAFASNGDWAQAVEAQRRALELARELAWNVAAMEQRLAAYGAQRVWRGDLLYVPPRATPPPAVKGRHLLICEGKECGFTRPATTGAVDVTPHD